jgi:hypothetical protein
MKPIEEGHPGISPAKIAILEALGWKHASVTQVINRYMPERFSRCVSVVFWQSLFCRCSTLRAEK